MIEIKLQPKPMRTGLFTCLIPIEMKLDLPKYFPLKEAPQKPLYSEA